MRWKEKRLEQGQTRIVKRFAIIPVCLEGQYRWLETVYVAQRLEGYNASFHWISVRWATYTEYAYWQAVARQTNHYPKGRCNLESFTRNESTVGSSRGNLHT